VLPADARPFTGALAHRPWTDHHEELDALIERHAQGWTLDRIAPLERNILRVALLEMRDPELVAGERADPARGGDRRGLSKRPNVTAAPTPPASSHGILAAALREVRENPSAR